MLEIISSANKIRGEVSTLKIPFSTGEMMELAKTDHLLWKNNINYMFNGLITLDESKVQDHHVCRLGKWYFGEGKDKLSHLEPFRKLDAVHEQFHKNCAEAIQYYKQGKTAQVQLLVEKIDGLSTTVLGLLDEIKSRHAGND